MPANGHALLSASSANRWINCTPSARLCEDIEDTPSEFANEGSDAHSLCEWMLNKQLGKTEPKPELQYYSHEMEECANGYVSYIIELLEDIKQHCKDPIVLVEQRLDFSKYVEEGFGTGDCVIVADGVLHIIDYKHGKGVVVDSTNNPQMMLYALGALELFDSLYEINKISMTIYQPRVSNISTFEISKADLLKWAKEVLIPASKLAFDGKGNYCSGEWCRFCKAKHLCRERAKEAMKLAELDFKKPPILTDEEVEDALDKIDDLIAWANDIKDYALDAALKGKVWNRYKLVEGRSIRKVKDENSVAGEVIKAGYDPYEKKLATLTELNKRLGKKLFSELVEPYTYKPQGKPTLVKREDKRPEMNLAVNDFNDIEEEK